jgi:N6-L-threonylcarbamoyladenine synthase
MIVLGIETSCDETACAVVKDGEEVLSNLVFSQIVHNKYGGVVPELASREHIKTLLPLAKDSLLQGKVSLSQVDGIAVTFGPGLVGSLLVGISFAKALAYSSKIPFLGINHLEGHLFANFLEFPELICPLICLIVSGGHSTLVYVEEKGKYEVLGRTRDDAAGEAFDKVAKVLKIGYPGGPLIDKLSQGADYNYFKFPRAYLEEESLDFSFSGIKTAVAIYVSKLKEKELEEKKRDIAASFQEAVVDVLVDKTIKAAEIKNTKRIALAGGVAGNNRLREKFKIKAQGKNLEIFYPPPILCTDNGAMVACAGDFHLSKGEFSDLSLNAVPYAKL